MLSPSLSPQVFLILSRLVEEKTGMHYGEAWKDLFAAKVGPRAIDSGFDSLLDYYYFLRYDDGAGPELDRLIDALVVSETYFFREPRGLEVLVSDQLAPAIERGEQPRVWCAACSTGEEPLTLAMMLADRGLAGRCEIVATDLSSRAIERARGGEYSARSLRALPPSARRWISTAGERVEVDRSIRDAVTWRRLNLTDGAAVAALGTFDLVACRNVLIYFSDETTRRVAEGLARALRPGGALLVGASESLLRFGTLLSCEERGGAFLYRRPP